jgi:hypothetical protein
MKDLFFYFWKTKIATVKETMFDYAYDVEVTRCCGYGPVTDEKYCPNCGRKIIK